MPTNFLSASLMHLQLRFGDPTKHDDDSTGAETCARGRWPCEHVRPRWRSALLRSRPRSAVGTAVGTAADTAAGTAADTAAGTAADTAACPCTTLSGA